MVVLPAGPGTGPAGAPAVDAAGAAATGVPAMVSSTSTDTVFGGRQSWSLQSWKYVSMRSFFLPPGASAAAFTGTTNVALSS